jgi:N-methylhydantoinase B
VLISQRRLSRHRPSQRHHHDPALFRDGRIAAWIGGTFHSHRYRRRAVRRGARRLGGRPHHPHRPHPPAGEENEDVIAFLEANLRQPDETLGDIRAQLRGV